MIDPERIKELREKVRKMADGWYPGHFDVPETWADLLAILDELEAARSSIAFYESLKTARVLPGDELMEQLLLEHRQRKEK